MAKKGGKRGSSAARSAAAKKGWETRRKGGSAAKSKPSTPSKPKAPPKTTTARGRARTAETLARAAVRSGGGTRAARSLLTAQRARDYYKATGTGTKRSKVRTRVGPASNIRRTGGLPRPIPASGIRRTTGPRRGPLAVKMNAVRAYKPATARGKAEQGLRQMRRAESDIGKVIGNLRSELQKGKSKRQNLLRKADQWQTKMERQTARDLANRSNPGVTGRIARIKLSVTPGQLQRAGADVIRRRAARATAAAARGSKPAARAREIYGQQLAGTGTGKPSRKAKSGIRPGPRNTKGTPPKRRKRKG